MIYVEMHLEKSTQTKRRFAMAHPFSVGTWIGENTNTCSSHT
jgi:hypothetical protein